MLKSELTYEIIPFLIPKEIFLIELPGGISTNRNFRLVDIDNNTYNNTASTEASLNIGLVMKPFTSK